MSSVTPRTHICLQCRCQTGFADDANTGDQICLRCGTVASEHAIDYDRNFSDSTSDRAHAEQTNEHSDNLSTRITVVPQSNAPTAPVLSTEEQAAIKLQGRVSVSPGEAAFDKKAESIEYCARVLNLSTDISRSAKSLLKQTQILDGGFHGVSNDGLAAALLIIAARKSHKTLLFTDVGHQLGLDRWTITSAYKKLQAAFQPLQIQITPPNPVDLVATICFRIPTSAACSNSFIMQAENQAATIAPMLEGHKPRTIAATAIEIAKNDLGEFHISVEAIAEASGVGIKTMRLALGAIAAFCEAESEAATMPSTTRLNK